MEADTEETKEAPRLRTTRLKIGSLPRSLTAADGNNSSKNHPSDMNRYSNSRVTYMKKNSGEMGIQRMSSQSSVNGRNEDSNLEVACGVTPKRGMILPFTPLSLSFDCVNYYVDMPPVSHPFPFSIPFQVKCYSFWHISNLALLR